MGLGGRVGVVVRVGAQGQGWGSLLLYLLLATNYQLLFTSRYLRQLLVC